MGDDIPLVRQPVSDATHNLHERVSIVAVTSPKTEHPAHTNLPSSLGRAPGPDETTAVSPHAILFLYAEPSDRNVAAIVHLFNSSIMFLQPTVSAVHTTQTSHAGWTPPATPWPGYRTFYMKTLQPKIHFSRLASLRGQIWTSTAPTTTSGWVGVSRREAETLVASRRSTSEAVTTATSTIFTTTQKRTCDNHDTLLLTLYSRKTHRSLEDPFSTPFAQAPSITPITLHYVVTLPEVVLRQSSTHS